MPLIPAGSGWLLSEEQQMSCKRLVDLKILAPARGASQHFIRPARFQAMMSRRGAKSRARTPLTVLAALWIFAVVPFNENAWKCMTFGP